jgi:hypothetical protein
MSLQPLPTTIPALDGIALAMLKPKSTNTSHGPGTSGSCTVRRKANGYSARSPVYQQGRSVCFENSRYFPRPKLTKVAKIVAEMWKNESEEVRAFWTQRAKEEEAAHKAKHPDYHLSSKNCKTNATKRKSVAPHSSNDGRANKAMRYDKPSSP